MLFNLTHQAQQSTTGLEELLIEARNTVSALQLGAHKRRKKGTGEEFRQFRPYNQDLDLPTSIDWRQSAKSDGLYVRDKELQTSQENIFWLDKSEDMNFKSEKAKISKLQSAQITAMALALLLAENHERISYAGSNKKGHSPKALEHFGQNLLSAPIPESFTIRKHATLFLISDFLSPIKETQTILNRYAQRASKLICIQILDPAERAIPYKGRVLFTPYANGNKNGNNTHEIQSAESIAQDYQKEIDGHINAVQTLCEKQGASYALHITNQDLRETLRNLIFKIMEAPNA